MASGSSKSYSILSLVAALGAASIARKSLDKGWRAATGKKPPENPADPDTEVWEAIAWAVTTGAVVALAKMLAQRRAAGYYTKSTGHLPPQLEKDGE